jgi:hypothetical protein
MDWSAAMLIDSGKARFSVVNPVQRAADPGGERRDHRDWDQYRPQSELKAIPRRWRN